jgi:hypothetical protein
VASKIENLEPLRRVANTETPEPNRVCERIDMPLPMAIHFKMEKLLPMAILPKRLGPLPDRKKLRSDKALPSGAHWRMLINPVSPICIFENMESADPAFATARNDTVLPKSTTSNTLSALPKTLLLQIDTPEPKRV